MPLPTADLAVLGEIHFLASRQVAELIDSLPQLLKRLSATTAEAEEENFNRIRGHINWGKTYGRRAALGTKQLFVTQPSFRAFDTPENRVLVYVLARIVELGRMSWWYHDDPQSRSGLESETSHLVNSAAEALSHRTLETIPRDEPHPRDVARVRGGRRLRDYGPALRAYDRYRELVWAHSRERLREAIEEHALVTRRDDVLFELQVTFRVLDTLDGFGWEFGNFGLIKGSLAIDAVRNADRLRLSYQRVPQDLAEGSHYASVLAEHGVRKGTLRPDLVLAKKSSSGTRWLVIEVKGGVEFGVEKYARDAAFDLFAYQSVLREHLPPDATPWGLGVPWGKGLRPAADSELALATPDQLKIALEPLYG